MRHDAEPSLPVRIRDGLGLLAAREARRYGFGLDALRLRLWGRVRVLPWSTVHGARLAASGTRLRLHLTFEGGRVVRIPLASFHGSVRLLQDIERRLPVAVASTESLKTRLEKLDRA